MTDKKANWGRILCGDRFVTANRRRKYEFTKCRLRFFSMSDSSAVQGVKPYDGEYSPKNPIADGRGDNSDVRALSMCAVLCNPNPVDCPRTLIFFPRLSPPNRVCPRVQNFFPAQVIAQGYEIFILVACRYGAALRSESVC